MLNVSLAQTDQELEEKFDQPNLKLGDLIPIQIKILGVPNLPISYVYAILNTSLNPQVLSEARKIREARAREYIAHYRKLHPAVVRS